MDATDDLLAPEIGGQPVTDEQPPAQMGQDAASPEGGSEPADQERDSGSTATDQDVRQQAALREALLRQYIAGLLSEVERAKEERFQQDLEKLPEAERDRVRQIREIQRARDMIAAREQQIIRNMQALEPVFKDLVIQKLLNDYRTAGVSREDLEGFDSPEAMEHYCKVMAKRSRVQRAEARAQKGIDRAASSASGSPAQRNWFKEDTITLINEAFS